MITLQFVYHLSETVALFATLEMQNGDMVIFFLRSFRKSEILKKAVSGRRCINSNCYSDNGLESCRFPNIFLNLPRNVKQNV